ncbi:MAG: DUF1080 domain-containing protein [Planctomyces sp.]
MTFHSLISDLSVNSFRIVSVVWFVLMTLVDTAPAADFKPLFNGRDLSGWVLVNTPAETWSVQDDMLICSGKPIGEIRTDRMYQNFILEVEWRHMVPGGNAGIFVWADDITAKGVPFHRSVEIQVLENAYGQSPTHTTHGDIFPIHGATMTPVNGRGGSRAFPTEERSKPSPEWNHYRIECRDGSVTLAVNGKAVTRGLNASLRKGYICIESEGGVVHYRNVKIQELPDTPVTSEQTAIADRGYRSFYNGLNLTGWKTSKDGLQHWKSNDWILAYDGKAADIAGATLTSSESVVNQSFLLDIKPGSEFEAVTVCGIRLTKDQLTSGEWSRIEVNSAADRIVLRITGGTETFTSENPVATSATFNLHVTGAAEFANAYVRKRSGNGEWE